MQRSGKSIAALTSTIEENNSTGSVDWRKPFKHLTHATSSTRPKLVALFISSHLTRNAPPKSITFKLLCVSSCSEWEGRKWGEGRSHHPHLDMKRHKCHDSVKNIVRGREMEDDDDEFHLKLYKYFLAAFSHRILRCFSKSSKFGLVSQGSGPPERCTEREKEWEQQKGRLFWQTSWHRCIFGLIN